MNTFHLDVENAHAHGHLFRDCPQNIQENPSNQTTKDVDGFEKAPSKRKIPRKNLQQPPPKGPRIRNSFETRADIQEAEYHQ
jgi:hypothetical protein